jgi:predicted nucleic acid-binding protein
MIVYLDASALVKKYIEEIGSEKVDRLIDQASTVGTSPISRAEVAAAVAKTVRTRTLPQDEASAALRIFRIEWPDLARLQITETTVARADALAWQHGLRGYDAVHLAAALIWQEAIAEPITLATFDRQLWQSGQAAGLAVWPEDLTLFVGK